MSKVKQQQKHQGVHHRNKIDMQALLPERLSRPLPIDPPTVVARQGAPAKKDNRSKVLQLPFNRYTQLYGCWFDTCGYAEVDREGVVQHIVESHFPSDPDDSTCHICGEDKQRRQNLRKHLATHFDLALPCSVENCNAGPFRTRLALETHEGVHKGKHRTFSCDHCTEKFRDHASLNEHVNITHLQVRFLCSLCGQKTATLKTHLSIECPLRNGQITFQCNVSGCGRTFGRADILANHIREFHAKIDSMASLATALNHPMAKVLDDLSIRSPQAQALFNDYGPVPQSRYANLSNERKNLIYQLPLPVRIQSLKSGACYTFTDPRTLQVKETIPIETATYDFATALQESCTSQLNLAIDSVVLKDAISGFITDVALPTTKSLLTFAQDAIFMLANRRTLVEVTTIDNGRPIVHTLSDRIHNESEPAIALFYHDHTGAEHLTVNLKDGWSAIKILEAVVENTVDAYGHGKLLSSYGTRQIPRSSEESVALPSPTSVRAKRLMDCDDAEPQDLKRRRTLALPDPDSQAKPKLSHKSAWFKGSRRPSDEEIPQLASQVDWSEKGWTMEKKALLICHYEGLHGYTQLKSVDLKPIFHGQFSADTMYKMYKKWLEKPVNT